MSSPCDAVRHCGVVGQVEVSTVATSRRRRSPVGETGRSGKRGRPVIGIAVVGGHVMPITGQPAVTRSETSSGEVVSGDRARRVLRHRRRSAQSLRRAQVPCGTGREATGHQVLVGRAPHRAGCLALAPPGRALRAVASFVRFVCGQQRPPPRGEARDLGARYGQQGRRISAVRELGKHIESLPHRVAQNLSQDRVHRTSPSLSRLISGEPQRGAELADPLGRHRRGCAGRSGENHPVPIEEHLEGPGSVVHTPALHPQPIRPGGLTGIVVAVFRSGDGAHRFRFAGLLGGIHFADVLSVLGCLLVSRLERTGAGWLGGGRRPDIPRDERSADFGPADHHVSMSTSPSVGRSLNLRSTPEKLRGVFK